MKFAASYGSATFVRRLMKLECSTQWLARVQTKSTWQSTGSQEWL